MLETLLAKGQHYDIFTKVNNFSNHLPMTLIALNRLGASDKRLQAFNDYYATKLKPLESASFATEFAWEQHLGENELFTTYLAFYTQRVNELGINEALRKYIDTLIPGCAASAFHALIRLSYGVIQSNKTEVAFGLAHLSAFYFVIPDSTTSHLSAQTVFSQALASFSQYRVTGSSISAFMLDIVNHDQFLMVNLYPDSISLPEISDFFAKLYLQTGDFTVLHSVTSCHALRTLIPFMQQPELAIKSYWSAALVAVLSINDLEIKKLPELSIEPIENLDFNVAINSADDHVIKLVFSCLEEYKQFGHRAHLMILNAKLQSK